MCMNGATCHAILKMIRLVIALITVTVAHGLDRKNSMRCASQGDMPTVCSSLSTVNDWTCEDFIAQLKEFASVYRERPIQHNTHGVGVNHAFALWFVLMKMKPTHVIESGVYRGQGTWLIRKTVGPDVKVFSIDPRKPDNLLVFKDTNPNTIYFMGDKFKDFAQLSWQSIIPKREDRENTLVVLDDHMSAIKRVQQMMSFGFRNLWYDDNWKYQKVDVYSFNTLCSPLDMNQNQVLYLDNFGNTSQTFDYLTK